MIPPELEIFGLSLNDADEVYCPVCQRTVKAEKINGMLLFQHDDIDHDDLDIEALDYPMQ